MTDWIGRSVGPYRLEAQIGGGAMAGVFRAIDENTGNLVALKLLLPAADTALRQRFQREMQTAAILQHPNIVPTLAFSLSNDSGAPFIAMELVVGESLGALLERAGQLSMVDSCALLAPIANALAYAHGQGVVHRDVKPSNILLRYHQSNAPGQALTGASTLRISALDTPVTPLLSDFGIALVLDAPELTSAGRTVGTPAYMAPEQCAGGRVIDQRADIYALGAVLYRCLVGRPLYVGSTPQILHAHVYDPVTIPDEHLRLLSPLVVEILRRCLAKDPAERYAHADLLAEDLAVAAGRKVRALTRVSTSTNEATRTLAAISAIPATTTALTLHVLVPAQPAKTESIRTTSQTMPTSALQAETRANDSAIHIPHLASQARTSSQQRSAASLAAPPAHKARQRSAGNWLAGGLTAFVLIAGLLLVNAIWPRSPTTPSSPPGTPYGAVSSPQAAPLSPTTVASATKPTMTAGLVTSSRTPLKPTLVEPPRPINAGAVFSDASIFTATTPFTATGDPALFLVDGQEAFVANDWEQAIEALIFVRRIDATYKVKQIIELLAESYWMQAASNHQRGDYPATSKLLKGAQKWFEEGSKEASQLSLLEESAKAVQADGVNNAKATDSLQSLARLHLDYANQLAEAGRNCNAVRQMLTAMALDESGGHFASAEWRPILARFRQACAQQRRDQRQQEFLASLTGSLIYSAGRSPNIYRIPVTTTARSELLIANAAYPALQRSGTVIAYYSTRPDALGVYGYDWRKLDDPSARGLPLATRFVEDGRDEPISWSLAGDRIVFASTRESDRRSRVYVAAVNGGEADWLGFGRYPAWRPLPVGSGVDWLVFNGTDATGNTPGLWLLSADGGQRLPLTADAGDIRPQWTPDGRSLIFMNQSRSGRWNIYRALLNPFSSVPQVQTISTLTGVAGIDEATLRGDDVLPAVSPDGKALAFFSNRHGRWQIWVMPLTEQPPAAERPASNPTPDTELDEEDVEELPLGAIALVDLAEAFPDWSQHALQWTK